MGEVKEKTQNEEIKKPSYEDLKNYCNQLLMQRNKIAERLNEVTDVINKLPWLFKVIENASSFSASFVEQCVAEVESIMTPPAPEEKEAEKEENKE